jgi:hypothetical protein
VLADSRLALLRTALASNRADSAGGAVAASGADLSLRVFGFPAQRGQPRTGFDVAGRGGVLPGLDARRPGPRPRRER